MDKLKRYTTVLITYVFEIILTLAKLDPISFNNNIYKVFDFMHYFLVSA